MVGKNEMQRNPLQCLPCNGCKIGMIVINYAANEEKETTIGCGIGLMI